MNPSQAIQALLNAKWTQYRIAEKVGTTQANISKILGGRKPNYGLGLELVKLGTRYANRSVKS